MTVFKDHITPAELTKIGEKDWYRHGIYRDSILFASLYIPHVGKEYFKEEWLPIGLTNLVRIDGQTFITASEFNDFRDRMFRKIENDKDYLDRYIQEYRAHNDAVLALSETIQGRDFSSVSSEELARVFSYFHRQSAGLSHWLWSMEFLNPAVEKHVKAQLAKKNPGWSAMDIADFLSRISYIPHKLAFQMEQEDILSLIPGRSSDGMLREILHQKYAWLNMYTWDGRPWSLDEYKSRIQDMLDNKVRLGDEAHVRNKNTAEAETLIGECRDRHTQKLLRTIQYLIYLKTHRIDVYTESWSNALGLVDEICARTAIPYDHFLNLTLEETLQCLGGKLVGDEEMRKRAHAIIARIDNTVSYYYGDAFGKIEAILNSAATDNVREIKGQVGYKGIARGRAKVLLSDRDLPKLERGDILVANLTNPNYNPAFGKVVAVVTDEGGILCHSAIMAREFSLPCVIGTKIATQVIKDGDLIEVDANRGVVTKIS